MSCLNRGCPACGEGSLIPTEEFDLLTYLGQKRIIKDYYSVCDACGSEIADAKQSRLNKEEVLVARGDVMDMFRRFRRDGEDWQAVVLAMTYIEEVDCNSGRRRRIWRKDGSIKLMGA